MLPRTFLAISPFFLHTSACENSQIGFCTNIDSLVVIAWYFIWRKTSVFFLGDVFIDILLKFSSKRICIEIIIRIWNICVLKLFLNYNSHILAMEIFKNILSQARWYRILKYRTRKRNFSDLKYEYYAIVNLCCILLN